jgi:probable F420-dependent oxidoreductase
MIPNHMGRRIDHSDINCYHVSMASNFRFAVQDGPFTDPVSLRAHAAHVESLGYHELYSADHIMGGAQDPFIPLIVAAEATTTLRVGPLVLNNEFHHPAMLARTALSVDHMTSGRLVLGLGTGYAQSEHDATGITLRAPAERVDRFGESLHVLRELLDTGQCTFDGTHHQIAIDELKLPATQRKIPFLIGGHGKRVVTLAARSADIFQFTGLTHGPDGTPGGGGFAIEEVDQRAEWLSEAQGARSIERSALVQFTAVGDAAPTDAEMAERFGLTASIFSDSPFVLVGSVEQIVDKIERLRERIGVTHYVVRDPDGFAPVLDALTGT